MALPLRKLVRLEHVACDLRDGDLLLFRRRGLISIAGRGVHSHAAKVAWWGDTPFCLEVREWYGGRAVTLASQVNRCPGRIDVFRANPGGRWPEYDAAAATRYMRQLAGCDYGYASVLSAALLHLPIVRAWMTAAPTRSRRKEAHDGGIMECRRGLRGGRRHPRNGHSDPLRGDGSPGASRGVAVRGDGVRFTVGAGDSDPSGHHLAGRRRRRRAATAPR